MLAIIITVILSPGVDHTPGVLGDGPFSSLSLFKFEALFQIASDDSCTVKIHLLYRFRTLSRCCVSVGSLELCCPKLERTCRGVAASKNTVELVPW